LRFEGEKKKFMEGAMRGFYLSAEVLLSPSILAWQTFSFTLITKHCLHCLYVDNPLACLLRRYETLASQGAVGSVEVIYY
jgi:hypothetical protein